MHEELYKENILDHYKNPRNERALSSCAIAEEGYNKNCGDRVTLFVALDKNDVVTDASFTGDGCAVSIAATSMLTEKLAGKTLAELKILSPGDIYTMLSIPVSPGRANCALLSYKALSKGIAKL